MPLFTVASRDYPFAVSAFAVKRLRGAAAAKAELHNGSVTTEVGEEDLESFIAAVAELIVLDLRPYETARLISMLPVDRDDRGLLLQLVLAGGGKTRWLETAKRQLTEYFKENSLVIAEGFLRFRLQSVLEEWAMLADRAGQELMRRREYAELIALLYAVAEAELAPLDRPRAARLILYDDGTAALTDASGRRAECSPACEGCVMGMLLGLAPERVDVYDLTSEGRLELLIAIKSAFGPFARLFVRER